MSMIIANNISAINTQRQFGNSARGMSTSMERLSSGFKINTGKDDPSGLLISEKLRSKLNGIERAKQNTEEAMNVMSIAEGALSEMNDILKKMKSLATHSANTGVTTSDQIQADQSELDSAVQTIDRIAQTTEFAGDKLLNGAKEISYDQSTSVKGTQQNSLINTRESGFSQIFKRDGYSVSVSYTGAMENVVTLTGVGDEVDFSKQATKAYMEVDTGTSKSSSGQNNPKAQIKDGVFTQDQTFTLTGSQGSRQFNFNAGKSITDLVSGIHNAAGVTGIDASLIFNSDQSIDKLTDAADLTALATTGNAAKAVGVYGTQLDAAGAAVAKGVEKVNSLAAAGVQWGKNTDGQGNIYIKYISDTEVELYKDASMSKESLVASGRRDTTNGGLTKFSEANNSGLTGIEMTIKGNNLAELKGNYISTGGVAASNGTTWSGNIAGSATSLFNDKDSVITGVELGVNTDADGRLHFKTTVDKDGLVQVSAYKDENMNEDSLVAQSDWQAKGSKKIILNAVENSDGTANTGLGITLVTNANTDFDKLKSTKQSGSMTFDNLGARVYASDYGSENFIKVTQDEGAIFTTFDSVGEQDRTLLEAGKNGTTKLMYGQDATVSINGKAVKTNGLKLDVATQDIQANFTFNAGDVGSTTIAQVGYGSGSLFTKAGALNMGKMVATTLAAGTDGANDNGLSAYLCNAGHNTDERLGNFEAGMQLQLGEGASDQNRTVVSLKSMTTENLGRITREGYWDEKNPTVLTEKQFTLKDIQGGGLASLREDPTLTMAIIDKAIDDVAGQRATIGAMQSNLLQTNANNLEVTLENITKTESGIRDADMASEMAEFTKNQVLQSAAMSMMSQANAQSQNALQLLR